MIAYDLSEKLKSKNLSSGFFETNYYPDMIFVNRDTKEIMKERLYFKK